MSKRRAHRRSERFDLQKRGVRIVLGSLAFTIMAGSLLGARLGLSTQVLLMAQEFLTFYAGVFSLVALTATVGLGLLTSERMILPIRWRVRAQLVHRGAALIGVGFLVVHIGMKIAAGLVPSYGSVIPTTNLAVGAGAVASDLFIVIVATGVMRGRFAMAVHPWIWRGLHDLAYLAWPVSILHGLAAGRTPAPWVAWSYILCIVAVGTALMIRAIVSLRPKTTMQDEMEELPMPQEDAKRKTNRLAEREQAAQPQKLRRVV